jgi:hypothetical protein
LLRSLDGIVDLEPLLLSTVELIEGIREYEPLLELRSGLVALPRGELLSVVLGREMGEVTRKSPNSLVLGSFLFESMSIANGNGLSSHAMIYLGALPIGAVLDLLLVIDGSAVLGLRGSMGGMIKWSETAEGLRLCKRLGAGEGDDCGEWSSRAGKLEKMLLSCRGGVEGDSRGAFCVASRDEDLRKE